MSLELRMLLGVARRWWFLLLMIPFVTGIAAYGSASQQQKMYSTSSTLFISLTDPSQQNLNDLEAVDRLGATYQRLLTTNPVLQAVINRLQLPISVNDLRRSISASAITGTQLLTITVVDSNPDQAAQIANTVASEFILVVTERSSQLTSGSREVLEAQITATQLQVTDLTDQITSLENSEEADTTDGQLLLATLRSSLTQQQILYGNLLTQQQQMDLNDAAIPSRITVWEQADAPSSPYAPRTVLYTVLAIVVGLLIAIAGIFLLEYVDNTIKSVADVSRVTELPVLAEIRSIAKLVRGRDQLFVLNRSSSSASEAVRLLRTNLEFASASKAVSTLLVSSAGPAEGKSTVTANLAVALANAGLVTVIVDADLRRPTQHQIFDLPNARGLTSLLTNPQQPWHWAAVAVIPSKLYVIPSGPQPPNPTDLLSTERMGQLLTELKSMVDFVVIDSPPMLGATDPLVLAPLTDGVVLLCRSGQTRQDALRRAVVSLRQHSIRILGVVINDQSERNEGGYSYVEYHTANEPDSRLNLGASATISEARSVEPPIV